MQGLWEAMIEFVQRKYYPTRCRVIRPGDVPKGLPCIMNARGRPSLDQKRAEYLAKLEAARASHDDVVDLDGFPGDYRD